MDSLIKRLQEAEPACERLPPWNDLTNEQRGAICDTGEYWANEDGMFGREAAHAIYNKIRDEVSIAPPPLLTALQSQEPTPPHIQGEP